MSPESKTRGLVDVAFVASCRAPRASRLRTRRTNNDPARECRRPRPSRAHSSAVEAFGVASPNPSERLRLPLPRGSAASGPPPLPAVTVGSQNRPPEVSRDGILGRSRAGREGASRAEPLVLVLRQRPSLGDKRCPPRPPHRHSRLRLRRVRRASGPRDPPGCASDALRRDGGRDPIPGQRHADARVRELQQVHRRHGHDPTHEIQRGGHGGEDGGAPRHRRVHRRALRGGQRAIGRAPRPGGATQRRPRTHIQAPGCLRTPAQNAHVSRPRRGGVGGALLRRRRAPFA